MIKRCFLAIIPIFSLLQISDGQIVTNADVPVAPLQAVAFNGWTNAFKFRNPTLEMVIAPDVGRIVYLAMEGGTNLLRLDEGLLGHKTSDTSPKSWVNYGGDWFWPVAQSRWADFNEKDWPPPPAMAETPWEATAWKGADGSQHCLLNRTYGEPLNIKVSRLFKLENGKAVVTVRQRIERTKASSIPVSLWNISQISRPNRIVLSVDTNSVFENGFKVLNFDAPSAEVLSHCEQAVVLNAQAKGEYKLGSDSEGGWVAAQKGNVLVIEKSLNTPSEAPYPDGGCELECYVNAGLGYAEIETLSPEKCLKPGESLENTLLIQVANITEPLDDCALADQIRTLLSEP